jgi:predicted NBD/HSP70 family sugar kinase
MAAPRRTSRDIRSESRLDVLHTVLVAGETTRNEITGTTGLSPSTVATIVGELIAEDIVTETKLTAGRIGRPTATLTMNASRGLVVGIDVAETYVRAVLFDAALGQVASVDEPRDEHHLDPATVVEGIGGALDHLLERAGVTRDDVLGGGIALPGLVQGVSGASVVVPHWTWHKVELERLRERVGLPLIVDNPLKVIATAELWLGRGRYCSSMVTINLGTGVGAGIVLESRILRGATNSAGEWGHTLLVLDGRACRCGRRGCVEAYAGRAALEGAAVTAFEAGRPTAMRDIQDELGKTRMTAAVWARALEIDDPLATRLFNDAVDALGCGIASAINLLDLDTIVSIRADEYIVPLP